MECQLRYLTWQKKELAASGLRHVKLKQFREAYREGGPRCVVQLREILDGVGERSKNQGKVLYRRFALREDDKLIAEFGINIDEDLFPSRLMRQHGVKTVDDRLADYMQQEMCATLNYTLRLVLKWLLVGHAQRKEKAMEMFRAILVKAFAGQGAEYQSDLLRHPDVSGQPRPCGYFHNGHCMHIMRVCAECGVQDDKVDFGLLASLLVASCRQAHKCNVLKDWVSKLFLGVVKSMEAEIFKDGGFNRHAANVVHLRGPGGKRRRSDAEQRAAAGEEVAAKRQRTVRGVARSGVVDVDIRTAARFNDEAAARYVASMKAVFSGVSQLTLCYDESSVGREPTNLAFVFAPEKGKVMPAFKRLLGGPNEVDVLPDEEEEAEPHEYQTGFCGLIAGSEGARALQGAAAARERQKGAKHATYQLIRALDHGLSLIGLSLGRFVHSGEETRPLKAGEVRYIVDTPKWGSYDVPQGVPWRRAVVKCAASGKKRFEAPAVWPGGRPPLLTVVSDEGGINMSAYHFLANSCGLRIVMIRDSPHRVWRDCQLALNSCDMWTDILESLLCMTAPAGPWLSSSFYLQLREAAEAHFAQSNCQDPLFLALYEQLREDYVGTLSAPPHTRQEQQEVWERLQCHDFLRHRGKRVSMTRWFAWSERFEELDKGYAGYLYFLVLLNLHAKNYQSIWDAPVFDSPRPESQVRLAPVAKAKAKAGGRRGPRGRAQEGVDAQRQKCKNALHLAAELWAQPSLRRRARLVHCCMRPLWEAFSQELRSIGEPREWRAMQKIFATAQYGKPLRKVMLCLASGEVLAHCGFRLLPSLQASEYRAQYEPPTLAAAASAWCRPCKAVQIAEDDQADTHYSEVMWRLVVRRGLSG